MAQAVRVIAAERPPRPLLIFLRKVFILSSTERPDIAMWNSSYCHVQLLGRRCRAKQGSLPGGASFGTQLNLQPATEKHMRYIQIFGVTVIAYYNTRQQMCICPRSEKP